jgi:hypothetical protein
MDADDATSTSENGTGVQRDKSRDATPGANGMVVDESAGDVDTY